jgi:translocator protein
MPIMSIVRLVLCVVLCLGIGALGGWVTYPEIATWYVGLAKPPGTPPNWVFPWMWNTLYVLMGASLWLLWDRSSASGARRAAIGLFFAQLALNAAWSPVFFGMHRVAAALVVILAMVAVTAATIVAVWPVKRAAALLLMPYLGWITYATWLNGGIWWLN